MSETRHHESDSQLSVRLCATEKDLEETRALFSAIFDFGPFPMWISDHKGTCLRINEALRRTWGVEDQDVIGKYNMFDDPVVKEQGFSPLLNRVFDDGESVTLRIEYDPVQFNQLTGAHREVKSVIEATISPQKNSLGEVISAIVLHKDLTPHQLMEEAKEKAITLMKQAQKREAVGLLVAGVAHEINQPLTYIRAVLECNLHDLTQQEIDLRVLGEECREAVKQVDRISCIIRHLRLFGRVETLSFREVVLDEILDSTLILVGHLLQANHITLKRDLQENLPCILCDPLRLEQVLINLFQNAVSALDTVEDKQIAITAVARDDLLILCFNDNGTGVRPDLQGRIFDPFVTTKKVGQGMGLGLSIVYGIIKEHDGDIQYYAEKQGSTFVITLPLKRAPNTPPES
ncbi:MAG: GHKL domain-containing protein [Phycisphaerae bacterium]|nr:GHKL domain-containing protein [Phycisphaerae bacterium]